MNPTLAVVLAHQGGWDEVLLIIGPMLVVVLLLWLAKRRVDRSATPSSPSSPLPGTPSSGPGSGGPGTGGSPTP